VIKERISTGGKGLNQQKGDGARITYQPLDIAQSIEKLSDGFK
jgi:hypothetical protein